MPASEQPHILSSMRNLIILCVLKFSLSILLVMYAGLDLDPDEAQYWSWSRALDWGYYSKPPGIAWSIWLGTQIFGASELGVRFGAICIGTAIPAAIYALARACQLSARHALWGAIAFACCPLGIFGGFFATTDGGMILFWTLACALFCRHCENSEKQPWVWIGLLIMCAALFKWTAYVLWIALLLRPGHKGIGIGIGKGIAVSALGLLPSLYWNATNDWATFRHVWGNMSGGPQTAAPSNFIEFFAAQVGLVTPIFFVLFVIAAVHTLRHWSTTRQQLRFCIQTTILIVGACSAMAMHHRMQANWAVYAYPTAFVAIAYVAGEELKHGSRWISAGAALALVIALSMILLPLPYKMRPFRHARDWAGLNQILDQVGYNPEQDFLFADRYQECSILSFYSPGQKRAYFLNLRQRRKNQFSYWPSLAQEQTGKSGVFLSIEHKKGPEAHLRRLLPYCESVEYLGAYPLVPEHKTALLFRCHAYNGRHIDDPELY